MRLVALAFLSLAILGSAQASHIWRSYLAGAFLSNNSVTPNTKFDVSAGQVTDDTVSAIITFGAGTIDCATVGANGLDAGALANNTWYHVYVISKAGGVPAALLASTSASSPAMPATYLWKRRIGSFKTNSSAQIIAFTQVNDVFFWNVAVLDMSAVNINTTSSLRTLTVPLGVKTRPLFRYISSVGNIIISSADEPDTSTFLPSISVNFGNDADSYYTNTSSQLRIRTSGNANITLWTRGWIDDRGKMN